MSHSLIVYSQLEILNIPPGAQDICDSRLALIFSCNPGDRLGIVHCATPSTYITSRGWPPELHVQEPTSVKLAPASVLENKLQARRKRTENSLFPILKQFLKYLTC